MPLVSLFYHIMPGNSTPSGRGPSSSKLPDSASGKAVAAVSTAGAAAGGGVAISKASGSSSGPGSGDVANTVAESTGWFDSLATLPIEAWVAIVLISLVILALAMENM